MNQLGEDLGRSVVEATSYGFEHSAYYLKWANEALAEAGAAFTQKGLTTVGQLSARDQRHSSAITSMNTARTKFAAFDFIGAAFAAQKAWRSAAALRDDGLGLAHGTTEPLDVAETGER
jgi:hypothetical protein